MDGPRSESLSDRLSLRRADAEPTKRIAGHLDRQLALAVDRLDAATKASKVCGFGVVVGPDDQIDPRIQRSARDDDQSRSLPIGHRHDHDAGIFDTRPAEQLLVRGVAVQRRDPARTGALDLSGDPG